jgi:hypothetical protein
VEGVGSGEGYDESFASAGDDPACIRQPQGTIVDSLPHYPDIGKLEQLTDRADLFR